MLQSLWKRSSQGVANVDGSQFWCTLEEVEQGVETCRVISGIYRTFLNKLYEFPYCLEVVSCLYVSITVSKIQLFLINRIVYNSPVLFFLRIVRFCTTGVINTKFIERIFTISCHFLREDSHRVPRIKHTLDFLGICVALGYDAELSSLHGICNEHRELLYLLHVQDVNDVWQTEIQLNRSNLSCLYLRRIP